MNKKVVYTSVFGNYDNVIEPKLPSDWDWKFFNETNSLGLYEDNMRSAKRYKILPHRYLSQYDISIYIDGNYIIRGDVNELIDTYLKDVNAAFHNHNAQPDYDKRNCIYDEAGTILMFGERNMKITPERGMKNYKDNPNIIVSQMQRYMDNQYPKNNGLITGGVILRKHNQKDCVRVMEDWWKEIRYGSKRDQLSFNYVAWKNKFRFNYMEYDCRDNPYFYLEKHTGKK
jgi:hypothetical protein|tara:strand:+ start:1634 stop:2320 length:687 start_codon:yes stop_codon:yes gene_type:complete